ncbi:MAG: hypothetical protein QXS69_02620 [Candidatus Aenigmatarchaeota archaeon]
MGMFDMFKKKEKKEEFILEGIEKQSFLPKTSLEIPLPENVQAKQTTEAPSQQIDKISLIESKLENLRIYLEMINSKLDRLEALLKSKGFI